MSRRPPRLDLTLPDPCRQVAEFCAEFPQLDYEDILQLCRSVERGLGRIRARVRVERSQDR